MNKWVVDSALNAKGKVTSGSYETNYEFEKITFIEADEASIPLEDFGYFMIDTEKLDQYWQSNITQYLPRNLIDLPEWREDCFTKGGKKLRKLISNIKEHGVIYSPLLSAPPTLHGAPDIYDGRHRFWIIRDLGIPAFPAAIPLNRVNIMQKHGLLIN